MYLHIERVGRLTSHVLVQFFVTRGKRFGIPGGRYVLRQERCLAEIDGRLILRVARAGELAVQQGQKAFGLQRRGWAVEFELAHTQVLAEVHQPHFAGTGHGEVLQRLAVHAGRRTHTGFKPTDIDVLCDQRAVHVGEAKIEADETAAVAGLDQHIADGTGVVGIELNADAAGVAAADVERQVLHIVVEPVRRAEAATPNDRLGLGGVGVGLVLQAEDRLGSALALQPVEAVGVVACAVLVGEAERRSDQVGTIREVDDLVLPHRVVEGFLDGCGVVAGAVALGVVGCLGHVHDVRRLRERDGLDLRRKQGRGAERQCKNQGKWTHGWSHLLNSKDMPT